MTTERLKERLVTVARSLGEAKIPYAFGGSIALIYWAEPRATRDIDVNIFLPESDARRSLEALASSGVPVIMELDVAIAEREGQVRLAHDKAPVDIFFLTVPFLASAADRTVTVEFEGVPINVLSAEDLVICKTLFDRDKDWLDIQEILMHQDHALDLSYVFRWLAEMVGPDNTRFTRLRSMAEKDGVAP